MRSLLIVAGIILLLVFLYLIIIHFLHGEWTRVEQTICMAGFIIIIPLLSLRIYESLKKKWAGVDALIDLYKGNEQKISYFNCKTYRSCHTSFTNKNLSLRQSVDINKIGDSVVFCSFVCLYFILELLIDNQKEKMNKQKPNALFWIVILTMIGGALALVYTLVLLLTSQGPVFARANVGNIVGLITSILLLLSGYLHIRNHRSDLFGLPGEGGND